MSEGDRLEVKLQHLEEKVEQLAGTVRGLAEERDMLRRQVDRLEGTLAVLQQSTPVEAPQQAQGYLASLYALTRERRFTFSPEELQTLETQGISLSQIIQELSHPAR